MREIRDYGGFKIGEMLFRYDFNKNMYDHQKLLNRVYLSGKISFCLYLFYQELDGSLGYYLR